MVALAMWGALMVLMVSSYGAAASLWGSTSDPRREGPPLAPFQRNSSVCHSELRQWPALLGSLALAVVPTIVAAAVTVYAKPLSRLATTLGGTGSRGVGFPLCTSIRSTRTRPWPGKPCGS
ncbi:hypothetical protein ACWDAO_15430 [Streptomyces sp. NPDC001212]